MNPRTFALDPLADHGIAPVVWTGSCSGTVDIARLQGPHDVVLSKHDASRFGLSMAGVCRLADPAVRPVVYEFCLRFGSQFDIYRWINLSELAAIFKTLRLPGGITEEWRSVLVHARLL
jgi:hypothetical protein